MEHQLKPTGISLKSVVYLLKAFHEMNEINRNELLGICVFIHF